MFDRFNNHIYSILILFIYTSASVYGETCQPYQRTCYFSSSNCNWCCSWNQYCGASCGLCESSTTVTPYRPPSSDFSTSLIILIVVVLAILLIACVCCGFRIQRQHQPARSPPVIRSSHVVRQPYQQQSRGGPIRVVHVRPVYNAGIAPPLPSIYEAPPPSYESATANLPPHYQHVAPPKTATGGQANTRL